MGSQNGAVRKCEDMKLLHELKGAFPNMADENIQQCIKQHGMDKTACSGALRMLESQQLSTTHNQNYAPARMMPLNNVKDLHNFPRKMSLQALISHQLNQRCKLQQCLQHSKSQLQNLSRDVDDLKVLLEARTQFIQNGVVDVDVSKELERDIIPKLQTSCDDLVRQVTHLTQGSGMNRIEKETDKWTIGLTKMHLFHICSRLVRPPMHLH